MGIHMGRRLGVHLVITKVHACERRTRSRYRCLACADNAGAAAGIALHIARQWAAAPVAEGSVIVRAVVQPVSHASAAAGRIADPQLRDPRPCNY
jgi:hypothetical protein